MNSLYTIQLYLVQHLLLSACWNIPWFVSEEVTSCLPVTQNLLGRSRCQGPGPTSGWFSGGPVSWEAQPRPARLASQVSPRPVFSCSFLFSITEAETWHRTESRRSGVQKWGLAMLLTDEMIEHHRLSGHESKQTRKLWRTGKPGTVAVHGVTK